MLPYATVWQFSQTRPKTYENMKDYIPRQTAYPRWILFYKNQSIYFEIIYYLTPGSWWEVYNPCVIIKLIKSSAIYSETEQNKKLLLRWCWTIWTEQLTPLDLVNMSRPHKYAIVIAYSWSVNYIMNFCFMNNHQIYFSEDYSSIIHFIAKKLVGSE